MTGELVGGYDPETDDGARIVGKAHLCENMWIPKELVKNSAAFLRASTVHPDPSSEAEPIFLAREAAHHIVVARHMFSREEWATRIGEWSELDLTDTWEKVGFVDTITPWSEEQQAAWDAFSVQPNGALNLACGKGKTVLALKRIAQRGFPAIVLVNTEIILSQWGTQAVTHLGIDEGDVGLVKGPKSEWDRPIVIGSIHTVARRADSLPTSVKRRFGTVIFDEAHHLSARTFFRTAPLFHGNRFGLTATPYREDGLESAYLAHLGPIFYTDLQGEVEADIFFKKMPTQNPADGAALLNRVGEFSVSKLHQYLSKDRTRNILLLSMVAKALDAGRKVLVLMHPMDYPERLLQEMLADPCMNMYTGCAVHGDVPGSRRAPLIRQSSVSFATYGVADEGLDVPELDTLICATPFKAWRAFQQGKGRIERRCPGKKSPLVVVLDDVNVRQAHGMCRVLRRKILANGHKYRIMP
jgi:hypothetical protein